MKCQFMVWLMVLHQANITHQMYEHQYTGKKERFIF